MDERAQMRNLAEFYKQQIAKELGAENYQPKQSSSLEYTQFKQEFMPRHLTIYEKLCNISEKILNIKPDKKKEAELLEHINIAHLSITPAGAVSLSFLGPLVIVVFGSLFSYLLVQSTFFIVFFFLAGLLSIKPLGSLPSILANSWRMKASNQMVLCIFYIVTYMRHTSNLENAIEFAADHLAPPLSIDLKKVLWNVETGKYDTVKESLDLYLETWKKWNFEFVESFHLIESSLYENSEERRVSSLDKSLDVILSETYEKMLHYAHNLQSPITMLHMLGIILPILGLVILPLMVSFMEGVKWYYIAAIYNIALPLAVYLIGRNILSMRPTGYGQSDIAEENPELKKYRNVLIKIGGQEIAISPLYICVILSMILLLIGFSPLILHAIGFPDVPFGEDFDDPICQGKFCLLGYKTNLATGEEMGPFGLGAAILSLAVTLGVGLTIGLYYSLRSKNVIAIRENAKKLEMEFASALFQLGNRLGDGLPAEVAFDKVSDVMEGTVSGSFFKLVSTNIRRLGLSLQRAIFDPAHGALLHFPSNLIESSMKVLAQSVRKGPLIAAQALTNVSRYIKEIHAVNERLKDLMADIISSMNSQIKFLTPAIAGIVVGITAMVTAILGKLGTQLENVAQGDATAGQQVGLLGLFGDGIPTFYFQIIVGLYVVQITYILTILVNGIENGEDKLNERYLIGKNMIRSTILYCIIALIVTMLFNMIAATILTSSLS